MNSKYSLVCFQVAAFVVSTIISNQAAAQNTSDSNPALKSVRQDEALDTVVVSSSRIVRDGSAAPTPQTVVGEAQLAEQGVTRLVDFALNVPALKDAGGARRGNNGFLYGGQGSLSLRGLGANRNLVLMDRRRVAPSTATGVVDLNTLPSQLLKRVDVVTGGASAAWGSDAVSGVVNLVLDTKFEGMKIDVSAGVSSYGDNEEQGAAFAAGQSFAQDRGHVVGSIEYYKSDGQPALSRDFLRAKPGIVNNPAWTISNGQPRFILAGSGIVTAYMTRGGIINGGRNANGTANNSLRGTAFGPGGVPYNFQYGTYVSPTGNMIAPVGAEIINSDYASIYDGVLPTSPQERYNAFLHAEYELSDSVTAFIEATVADNKTNYIGVAPYRFGTSATTWFSITADNPFLATAIREKMSGPGGGNPLGPYYLNVGRMNDDLAGFAPVRNSNKFERTVVGLDGRFGQSWSWNVYYQFGQNTYDTTYGNSMITSRGGVTANGNVNLAVDVVAAPAGNSLGVPAGTAVCRSTLINPNNGCKPLNIFGIGSASPEAIAYVLSAAELTAIYKQSVFEGQVQGEPFNTWAGPVSLLAGASYRKETVGATVDQLSLERALGVVNPQPYAGSYVVKELFAETLLPLAKDVPLIKELDVSAAVRSTSYSTTGTVNTWKIGLSYSPVDSIRFRATRSLDIRAASLDELYRGGSQSRTAVTDTIKGLSGQINILQVTGGNAALDPEEGDTLAYGVVIQPSSLPNLSLSVDRYDIEIKNVISTISAQETIDRCKAGNVALCAQIVRLGDVISTVSTQFLNLAFLETSGIDFEASYRMDVSSLVGNESSLGLRVLANYVDSYSTSDGRTTIQQAGSIADIQPKWNMFASITLKTGDFQFAINNKYVGSGAVRELYNVDPSQAIDDNKVAARVYTGVNLAYQMPNDFGKLEFFANADNIFDVKPPKGFGFGYGLNAVPLYDVIGPMYKVGVRARL